MIEDVKKYKFGTVVGIFLLLEVFLGLFILSSFGVFVSGGTGQNVTVATYLSVGASFPGILNVTLDDGATEINLVANSTKQVNCTALIFDYNNESDLDHLVGKLYSVDDSSLGDVDDNNYHYSNASCVFNKSFGAWNGFTDDIYHSLGYCTFQVEYYAVPGNWTCYVWVNDSANLSYSKNGYANVTELLAVGLPDSIDYGTVNSTYVSDEKTANVENVGNVQLNLSLQGYGFTPGDGNAMNCTLGLVRNISIDYEKYNLSAVTSGVQSLTQFESNYDNLTSTPVVKAFDLFSRFNDTLSEASNSTYWRIYVPRDVAGNCSGNIIFGATQADGS